MRRLLCVVALLASAPAAVAADEIKGVKKVTVAFEPAEAKPGATVTLKITVELAAGYHTYPTTQTDKAAASMVNKITFPAADKLIFVGETEDPADPDVKAEPEIGIKELKSYSGVVVYERKAVVNPAAAAGDATVKLTALKLNVCDANNCFPPKTLTPEATFKILSGPAVAVQKEYAEEVAKELAKPKEKK